MAIIEEPGRKSLDYEGMFDSILRTIEEIRNNNKIPIRDEYKIERHINKYPCHNHILITMIVKDKVIAWLEYEYHIHMGNVRPSIPNCYSKFFKDRGFYINTIRVLKEFRSKGYGTILMNECIRDIKTEHYNAILLVDAFDIQNNQSKEELDKKLRNWYRGFGFRNSPNSNYMILQNVKY